MPGEMLSNISGFYILDDSGVPPLWLVAINSVSRHGWMSPGGDITPSLESLVSWSRHPRVQVTSSLPHLPVCSHTCEV